MNGSGPDAPAGVLTVSGYWPGAASAGIVTSTSRAAAVPPGATTALTPGRLAVTSVAPSRFWPSRLTRTVWPRTADAGVALFSTGGFGLAGSGSPCTLPVASSSSTSTPS